VGEAPDRLEPNLACTRRIFRAWRELRSEFRPNFPTTLMRILRDWYQYPYPAFVMATPEFEARVKALDDAYDAFAEAINSLRLNLPDSEHWHPLQYLMEQRYPADADSAKLNSLFIRLERSVRAGLNAPKLPPRKGTSSRGAPVKHPEARTVVTLICWYVATVEKGKVSRGFEAEFGFPTGKCGNIIAATLKAMGITVPDSTIETGIRHFRNEKLDRRNYWELIPVLPPPNTSAPAA
jgi:hypothetical protein